MTTSRWLSSFSCVIAGSRLAHPVRLEPERELQLVAGEGLEVVRAVEPGGRVQRPARGLDQGEVLALVHVLRALEHHVLEEVREPGLARLLVLAADVVPQVHGHDGGGAIRRDDDAQSVVQAVTLEGDLEHAFLQLGGAEAGQPPAA